MQALLVLLLHEIQLLPHVLSHIRNPMTEVLNLAFGTNGTVFKIKHQFPDFKVLLLLPV